MMEMENKVGVLMNKAEPYLMELTMTVMEL